MVIDVNAQLRRRAVLFVHGRLGRLPEDRVDGVVQVIPQLAERILESPHDPSSAGRRRRGVVGRGKAARNNNGIVLDGGQLLEELEILDLEGIDVLGKVGEVGRRDKLGALVVIVDVEGVVGAHSGFADGEEERAQRQRGERRREGLAENSSHGFSA